MIICTFKSTTAYILGQGEYTNREVEQTLYSHADEHLYIEGYSKVWNPQA
jgi:hypothetical protein